MNQPQHTAPTLSSDRARRLRDLLEKMTARYGDGGPMVSAIRRNLAQAEAANSDAKDGQARR